MLPNILERIYRLVEGTIPVPPALTVDQAEKNGGKCIGVLEPPDQKLYTAWAVSTKMVKEFSGDHRHMDYLRMAVETGVLCMLLRLVFSELSVEQNLGESGNVFVDSDWNVWKEE